jgi:hypothetical protein
MWISAMSVATLFAQRPPPDWQNSFWSSPIGLLMLLAFVVVGGWINNKR